MGDLIREPDELWTSYLIRRLEGEGMNFPPFIFDGDFTALMCFSSGHIRESLDIQILRKIDVDETTPLTKKKCTYEDAPHLGMLIESASVSIPKGSEPLSEEVLFTFFGLSKVARFLNREKENYQAYFPNYEEGKEYHAQQAVEDIVAYALRLKPKSGFPTLSDKLPPEAVPARKQEIEKPTPNSSSADPRLDQILKSVRRLESIAAEHPIIMQGEDAYLRKLYVDTINSDANNLQTFEYQGQRIPYVLVDSAEIEGNVGKPSNNLYFVARDIATEPWQQQIVAVHESRCVKAKGKHAAARREELKVARLLGKEKEHRAWRKSIDAKFK